MKAPVLCQVWSPLTTLMSAPQSTRKLTTDVRRNMHALHSGVFPRASLASEWTPHMGNIARREESASAVANSDPSVDFQVNKFKNKPRCTPRGNIGTNKRRVDSTTVQAEIYPSEP